MMTKPKWVQVMNEIDPLRTQRKRSVPKPPKPPDVTKADIDRAGKFLKRLNS